MLAHTLLILSLSTHSFSLLAPATRTGQSTTAPTEEQVVHPGWMQYFEKNVVVTLTDGSAFAGHIDAIEATRITCRLPDGTSRQFPLENVITIEVREPPPAGEGPARPPRDSDAAPPALDTEKAPRRVAQDGQGAKQAATPAGIFPGRFYVHTVIGIGGWFASSRYNDGTEDDPEEIGTRDIRAFTLGIASTFAHRVRPWLAIGLHDQIHFMPYVHATENRRFGYRPLEGVRLGVAGMLGPSITLLRRSLRLDLSPGVLFVVTGSERANPDEPAFGGVGGGLSLAGGYDIPVSATLAVAVEFRVTTGWHANSDPTHTLGWDTAVTAMMGVRRW